MSMLKVTREGNAVNAGPFCCDAKIVSATPCCAVMGKLLHDEWPFGVHYNLDSFVFVLHVAYPNEDLVSILHTKFCPHCGASIHIVTS